MKVAVISLVLALAAYGSFAADFRKTSWLMSRDEVAATENGMPTSEVAYAGQLQLTFRTQLAGGTGSITYVFESDKLFAASYSFPNDDKKQVFASLRDSLSSSYGPPSLRLDGMLGWRLDRSEIALLYLPDNSCHLAYWEKGYFARINNLATSADKPN